MVQNTPTQADSNRPPLLLPDFYFYFIFSCFSNKEADVFCKRLFYLQYFVTRKHNLNCNITVITHSIAACFFIISKSLWKMRQTIACNTCYDGPSLVCLCVCAASEEPVCRNSSTSRALGPAPGYSVSVCQRLQLGFKFNTTHMTNQYIIMRC